MIKNRNYDCGKIWIALSSYFTHTFQEDGIFELKKNMRILGFNFNDLEIADYKDFKFMPVKTLSQKQNDKLKNDKFHSK